MSAAVTAEYEKYIQPVDEYSQVQDNFVHMWMSKGEATDLDEIRIRRMDECGVDVQIVGYGNKAPMHLTKEQNGVALCRQANDELYAATQNIYGYATLPLCDVEEAVKELERCVKELGFVGVIINGQYQDHIVLTP